ncbi:unnamed protein product [Nippostrongylus brasiliensis]|uniref:Cyclic nucleotide-binding domain-containing protein n=1 Tax=Nippostrongylus brasiliensis TaxID=27835 RepID=A0A0N4XVW7_NIPBR|nr:unnamed protein product [Nippostrongylus brasiliensis]
MAKQEKMSELEMRSNLPPKLYTRMNKYMQWTILKQSQLFEVNNCLVNPEEMEDEEMFVVASGYLQITDQNNFTLRTFNEGDIIEDRTLVWFPHNRLKNRRKYDVTSVGYSQVYILLRDDLLHVLKDYPSCREKIRSQGVCAM